MKKASYIVAAAVLAAASAANAAVDLAYTRTDAGGGRDQIDIIITGFTAPHTAYDVALGGITSITGNLTANAGSTMSFPGTASTYRTRSVNGFAGTVSGGLPQSIVNFDSVVGTWTRVGTGGSTTAINNGTWFTANSSARLAPTDFSTGVDDNGIDNTLLMQIFVNTGGNFSFSGLFNISAPSLPTLTSQAISFNTATLPLFGDNGVDPIVVLGSVDPNGAGANKTVSAIDTGDNYLPGEVSVVGAEFGFGGTNSDSDTGIEAGFVEVTGSLTTDEPGYIVLLELDGVTPAEDIALAAALAAYIDANSPDAVGANVTGYTTDLASGPLFDLASLNYDIAFFVSSPGAASDFFSWDFSAVPAVGGNTVGVERVGVIPEPASLGLALLAAPAMLRRRRA